VAKVLPSKQEKAIQSESTMNSSNKGSLTGGTALPTPHPQTHTQDSREGGRSEK